MNARQLPLVTLAVALLFATLYPVEASGQDQVAQGPTIKSIEAAWKARQDKIKSVRAAWSEKHVLSAGYLSYIENKFALLSQGDAGKSRVSPPKETAITIEGGLVFDQKRYHIKTGVAAWAAKTNQLYVDKYQMVFQNGLQKTLNGVTHPDFFPAGGQGKGSQGVLGVSRPQLRPILIAFAPVHPSLRVVNLGEYQLSAQRPVINKIVCVRLTRPRLRATSPFSELILDPAKGYNVVRQEIQTKMIYQRIDISYRNDNGHWVPQEWTIVTQHEAKKSHQLLISGVMTTCKINAIVTAKEFSLDFPPGTVVNDSTRKGQRLIIGRDGRAHEIPKAIYYLSHDDWMEYADQQSKSQNRLYWFVALGMLVVLGLCFVLWKKVFARGRVSGG